ncbi:MAG: helix-turn-helix transcriptional regulator [Pseudonocardiales bacterium]|nr:helix-turn-helix transcriptional regulator [Pseudonocardiales bacterium]
MDRDHALPTSSAGRSVEHAAPDAQLPTASPLDELDRDGLSAALAARDVSTIYRLLQRAGVSQRQIGQRTGQSQSEVCEILKGRQVRDVWILERIADGLGISRARLGVSFGQDGPETVAAGEVDEEMKRRAVLAATVTAALGQAEAVPGAPIELPLPPPPLPSRLSMSHVHAVRAVTEQLASLARYYGGQAALVGAAARAYTPWMDVPAPEPIKAQLAAALADLYSDAGWACYDEGVDGAGYFLRALRLAEQAADAYSLGYAAWAAGATLVRTGHPNHALKLIQLGQLHLGTSFRSKSTLRTNDPGLPSLRALLNRTGAIAYAVLGGPQEADRSLAAAHDGWEPRTAFDRASAEVMTAGIQRDLGRLEAAEQFATSALRSYGEHHRRGRTLAELLLAELYVRTGDSHGLTLAHQAIQNVSTLQSVAVRRQRLLPLATTLETRSGSDSQELARIAHQVAAQV